MKIPLVDLKAQYRSIKEEVDSAINDVIENTSFVLGPNVELFEKEFAEYCSARHCVGVSSGTDALYLILKAMGIKEGDEVITVANTFVATAFAIGHNHAGIRLVDCNRFYNMDSGQIEKAVTPKTRAILAVHLYGQPCDMEAISGVARKKGLMVIEDACQAHGAEYNGKKAGSLGKAAAFSFYPGKNLGAYGDGGAVVTDDAELAGKVRLLRHLGEEKKYHHVVEGHNCRLHSLQAAVLRVKLRHLDDWNEKRRRNAGIYDRELKGIPGIRTPQSIGGIRHVYHLYVIRCRDRDRLLGHLHDEGIGAQIHYPVPVHLQKAYRHLGYKEGDFPNAEKYAGEILSLPMFPELKESEIKHVASVIRRFYSS